MDFEATRKQFEDMVFNRHFMSTIQHTGLGGCMELMPDPNHTLTQDELCERDGDSYKRQDVSAMWFGWCQALELVAPAWQPIETAPRDGTPILGLCAHAADPYFSEDGKSLTVYDAHTEGLSHVEDGPHVLVWGGAFDDSTREEPNGANLPDWWFLRGSEFEVTANPTHWRPIPPGMPIGTERPVSACSCIGPVGNDPHCPCVMRSKGLTPTNPWTPEAKARLDTVLSQMFGWRESEQRFTLLVELGDPAESVDDIAERLARAGCTDATVGLGIPGRVALLFVRRAESMNIAVHRATHDVLKAIPTARRVEVATPRASCE